MKHNILKRFFWLFVVPSWIIITCTVITPIIWYTITGLGWISLEKIYNKINKNDE